MPRFVLLILAYFAIQAFTFGAFKTGGDIDTAELLVLAQRFAWGYGGSQPPLYNWLALAATKALGTELIVLSALKFGMLALALTSIYMGARALGLDRVPASAAVLGIFAIPEIGWEAQRSLSHSSAMIAFCAAGFWVIAWMQRRPANGIAAYGLLGIVLAAAFLSKYNAAVFFAALFLAASTLPAWRGILLNRLFLWSLLLAGLLVAPHLVWMAQHPELVGQRAGKLGIAAADGWVAARAEGLASLLGANLAAGGIVAIVYLVAEGRPKGRGWPSFGTAGDYANLPLRVFLIGNLLFALGIVLSGATDFLNRWLQPILMLLPLGLVLAATHRRDREATGGAPAPAAPRTAPGSPAPASRSATGAASHPAFVRWIRPLGAGFAGLALLLLPASIHFAPSSDAGRDKLDYAGLYGALSAAADARPGALVTLESPVFANLRLIDSDLRVLHPILGPAKDLLEEPVFLIWTGDPALPAGLAAYAAQLGLAHEGAPVAGWQLRRAGRDEVLPVWFLAARQE